MWPRAICIEVVFSELHTASFRSRARWLLSLCMQRVVDGNVWLYVMCVCGCIRVCVSCSSYKVCGLIVTLRLN